MPGQDEVGPADGEALEHRRSRSRARRARRARARSGRRRPRRRRRTAGRSAPGLAPPRRRRRPRPRRRRGRSACAGRWKAPRAVLAGEAELARERRDVRAAGAAGARPDHDRALALAQPVAELVALRASAQVGGSAGCAARRRRADRAPRRRCGARRWSQRSTIGARSATGSSPSTTTSSASRIAESGRRKASSASARLLRQHGGVRAEPGAHEPAERVGLLDRLGAGERGHDPAVGRAQQPLGLVERVVPRDRARGPRAGRAAAGRRSGRARRGA